MFCRFQDYKRLYHYKKYSKGEEKNMSPVELTPRYLSEHWNMSLQTTQHLLRACGVKADADQVLTKKEIVRIRRTISTLQQENLNMHKESLKRLTKEDTEEWKSTIKVSTENWESTIKAEDWERTAKARAENLENRKISAEADSIPVKKEEFSHFQEGKKQQEENDLQKENFWQRISSKFMRFWEQQFDITDSSSKDEQEEACSYDIEAFSEKKEKIQKGQEISEEEQEFNPLQKIGKVDKSAEREDNFQEFHWKNLFQKLKKK